MSLNAFLSGANCLCFEKVGKKYGMTCAWSTMLNYDQIGMLIGEQSDTGKALSIGDIVGVSSLSKGQEKIARQFGNLHSEEINKFKGIQYIQDKTSITIKNAKIQMKCEVTKLLKINEGSNDLFVVLNVISYSENKEAIFLSTEEAFKD